jgi:hypothetical protein
MQNNWKMVEYKGFLGVNNVAQRNKLPDGFLYACENYHLMNDKTLLSRKGYLAYNLFPLGWYVSVDCTNVSQWGYSADGGNEVIDTDDFLSGSSSYSFDKTGTATTYVYAEATIADPDYTRYDSILIPVKYPANVTSITVNAYVDDYNYFQQEFSRTEEEWHLLYLRFGQAIETGTPFNWITKIRVTFHFATAAAVATGILIDNVSKIIHSEVKGLWRFTISTGSSYIITIADGTIWIEDPEDGWGGKKVFYRSEEHTSELQSP